LWPPKAGQLITRTEANQQGSWLVKLGLDKLDVDRINAISLLEEVLGVLGAENLSVLYYHLERLGVKRSEIVDKPAEFSKALKVIFGQAATILESQIVSCIASKTGQDHAANLTLTQALEQLKEYRFRPTSLT